MMLVELTTPQISVHWDLIKKGLYESLPPYTYADPERMNNIFNSLLTKQMTCWFGYVGDIEEQLYGFVITTVHEDSNSKIRNLEIYALYATTLIPQQEWISGYNTLLAYAKGQHCHRIIAFTDVSYIIQIAERLGASTNYRFVTLDVS